MHATLKAPFETALESCGAAANEPSPLLAQSQDQVSRRSDVGF